ncbi:MAG: THUMP domain-containing protein [Promethearchaeati archaeon SRVP18_Atabeyarchaeia-1]
MTALCDKSRELMQELAGLGIFWETDFKDVIRGDISDLERFLVELGKRSPCCLSRFIPVERSFHLLEGEVVQLFKKDAAVLAEEIEEGESFCVKVNRRGLRGLFSSRDVARQVGSYVCKLIRKRYGERPNADLENPDKALLFETIGLWCGACIVSRELREECRYLRLP